MACLTVVVLAYHIFGVKSIVAIRAATIATIATSATSVARPRYGHDAVAAITTQSKSSQVQAL